MIPAYNGHFMYLKDSVERFTPDVSGVYYVGYLNRTQELVPVYIVRAIGFFTSIRSRLFDHLRDQCWQNTTHFGFKLCADERQAQQLESYDIKIYQPRYNTHLKAVGF
jgi:excinuclease UvrABC nuclease subunit